MTFWTNSGFEPKRAFRFKVSIAGIPAFYVKKITKPKFTLQEAEHKFLNRSYFFPGHVTWDPVTVTFVDDTSGLVLEQLTHVLNVSNYGDIKNKGDLSGLGAEKKKFRTVQKQAIATATKDGVTGATPAAVSNQAAGDGQIITIEQIDSTDLVVVEKIELYNGWIKGITPSELSYDTEDLSSYDIEIRYDWAAITGPENR
jgi:hypothetical protein